MSDDKPVWKPDLSTIRKIGEPKPVSEEERAEFERLAKERSDLVLARVQVLDAANSLDGSLVELLRTVSGVRDAHIASVLYFSAHSLHKSVRTIGTIIAYATHTASDKTFASDWKRLAERFKDNTAVRNLAAHGHIVSYYDPEKGNLLLLAPVMGQRHTYLEAFRKSKLPGFTLDEVLSTIQVSEDLRVDVDAYHARYKKYFVLG